MNHTKRVRACACSSPKDENSDNGRIWSSNLFGYNILQNVFFCVPQKKKVWNDMSVSK